MIDTEKYKKHTEGKWSVSMSTAEDITHAYDDDETGGYYFFTQGYNKEQEEDYDYAESHANARLMADAPLLLAEVKRLREAMKTMLDDMNNASPEEEIEYWLDTWKHWLKELIE